MLKETNFQIKPENFKVLETSQPVHSKGDQPWVFFGRNDAKAETPVFWPPHAKSWLIGKDPDAGRDWGEEEKGTTEDEMAGWHHQLDGCESEWTPGDGDGQGGLACCGSWGHKESDTTEQLNWTEFALIHGPNILDSYAIFLFIASDFISITSPIHNWVLFLLWVYLFILFLELFLHCSPVAYWAPIVLDSSIFSVLPFCFFILFMGFSWQEYWSGLPFPSPVDHILSDLSTMTHLSWVAPHGVV